MIVTSASREYLDRVGARAISSWLEHGRNLPTVVLVSEDEGPLPISTRVVRVRLSHALWPRFLLGHADHLYHGRAVNQPVPWRSRSVEGGYNFRFDAVKFAHKPVAIAQVADLFYREHDAPLDLIWLDADVVATRRFDYRDLLGLTKEADVTYLGRSTYHPDAAFLGFRLPATFGLLRAWRDLYLTGAFKRHKEWHDAYLLKKLLDVHWAKTLRTHDLNSCGRKLNAFDRSSLGAMGLRHLKGELKDLGAWLG